MNLIMDIWNKLNYYQSTSFSQKYLYNKYNLAGVEHPEQKSYDNCYPFMYYLEQAEIYYSQAKKSSVYIRPLLLFYGFVHLTKACLLTKDAQYPHKSSVMAHGVTSRKKKKRDYQFLKDEVKIQRLGLFSHFSEKMFGLTHFEEDKFSMEELLKQIPEMNDHFQMYEKGTFYRLESIDHKWKISQTILDKYHMTFNRFSHYMNHKSNYPYTWTQDKQYIYMEQAPISLPLRFHLLNDTPCLPSEKHVLNMFPEWCIHYMLLYNLSMIARYEIEWWSELNKMRSSDDFAYISSFLHNTETKSVHVAYELLTK